MKRRIQTGIVTVLFFALYPFWITSIAQNYQQAVQQARQYTQDQGSTAIYEEPLVVNGKDTDSHRRRSADYFLELRETRGRLRRVGVSEEFWTNAAQGDMVTGQIWRDKVRLVKDTANSRRRRLTHRTKFRRFETICGSGAVLALSLSWH